MAEIADIIIVGAGPAGVAVAAALLQAAPSLRDDLVLLEREQHPRHKLCGGGLTPWADELLQQLGLSVHVHDFRIEAVKFYLDDDPLVFNTPGILRTIHRDEFDAALVAAIKRKGIRLLENSPVEQLARTPEGVVVETPSASYLAKVVVGADGAKSLVRRTFFADEPSRVSRLIEVLAPVDRAGPEEVRMRTAVLDFRWVRHGLQGYIWDFPAWVKGRLVLNIGIFDSRVAEQARLPRADLRALLREHLLARGCTDEFEFMGHPVRWFHPFDRHSRPRVLLVGDAAGIEPWLGEGISTSLAYGPVAATTIVHALRSGDFSFYDYQARLLNSRLGKFLRRNRLIARLFYYPRMYPLLPIFGRVLESYMRRKEHSGKIRSE